MFDRIVDELDQANARYSVLFHEPIVTSDEAARVRGTNLTDGLKCLLLTTDHDMVLAVIPGDAKLDSRAMRHALQTKEVRFADPTDVKNIMGCDVGACYPLGHLIGVRTFFDNAIQNRETVVFNAGRHDASIQMPQEDLAHVVQPPFMAIGKS